MFKAGETLCRSELNEKPVDGKAGDAKLKTKRSSVEDTLAGKEDSGMQYRKLGSTGIQVSSISFGAWAIGDTWGKVDDGESMAALNKAVDLGVNFFDTADVYGDGRSEKLIGKLLKERPDDEIFVATKAGRRLDPHTAEGYNYDNLSSFVERSLENLGVEALDLLQLHCPPPEAYRQDETFEALDRLQEEGKLKNYGVSVEKVEEARMALDYPGVQTVQIVFNIFRQKPAEELFTLAAEKEIGLIVRVPLASGLLTGKMSPGQEFPEDDHRNFNREGEAFDRGETFAGVNFETGLEAAGELKTLVPEDFTLAQFALRWILMHPEVSCAILGGKSPSQVEDNTAAADMPPLSDETMERVKEIYSRSIHPEVHHLW